MLPECNVGRDVSAKVIRHRLWRGNWLKLAQEVPNGLAHTVQVREVFAPIISPSQLGVKSMLTVHLDQWGDRRCKGNPTPT